MTEQQIPDPRPHLDLTVAQLTATIESLTPAELDLPTQCDGWNVRDVIAHMVGVAERVARLVQGSVEQGPVEHPRLSDEQWSAAWQSAADTMHSAYADDAVLGAMVHPPFGDMPGIVALSIYVTEFTVHHWDIAHVAGRSVDWNEEIVAGALYGTMEALPAEGRDAPDMPFSPVVPTPADASTIDRLVAWMGRNPASG